MPDPSPALPSRTTAQGSTAAAQPEPGSEHAAEYEEIQHLDADSVRSVALPYRYKQIIERVGQRIEKGQFVLPHLPSTSQAVIDVASRPSVEFNEVVEVLEADPVLTSELLKTANSVMYAGHEPIETLHQAAVRIGLRALRSLVFSLSLRGVILRDKELNRFAEEVWRQAHSIGTIARAIAEPLGFNPERAYLLGLLQDVGKVPLLAMIRNANKEKVEITPALVGRLFHLYHEQAGAALAHKWNLDEELVAVAGCHHQFDQNETHPRSAALARLAHRLELYMSLEEDAEYRSLMDYPEMDFLGLEGDSRQVVIAKARRAYSDFVALPEGAA